MATAGHSYPPPLETYTPRVFRCESGVAGAGAADDSWLEPGELRA